MKGRRGCADSKYRNVSKKLGTEQKMVGTARKLDLGRNFLMMVYISACINRKGYLRGFAGDTGEKQ